MTNTGHVTLLLLGARHSKGTHAIILALILLIPPPLRPLCIQIIPVLFSCCQIPRIPQSPLHLAGSCIQNKINSQTWASPPSAVAPADEEAKCFWSSKNAAQKKNDNNENCSAHRGGRRTTTTTVCLLVPTAALFPSAASLPWRWHSQCRHGCPTAET